MTIFLYSTHTGEYEILNTRLLWGAKCIVHTPLLPPSYLPDPRSNRLCGVTQS